MKASAKIEVAEQEFELINTGRGQAEQVVQLGHWLAKHGLSVFEGISQDEESDLGMLGTISRVLSNLTPDALIELYRLILGCPAAFADEHFDVMVLIDAVITVYNEQPTIKRLVERFFSDKASTGTNPEPST